MPLSPPAPREQLHTRRYEFHGFRRADGLWDIEGRMTDAKHYPFPNEWRGDIQPGEPLHDMRVRVTVDDDLLITDIEAATAAGPFAICGGIAPAYAGLKGARIGPGWSKKVKDLFRGPAGCTHHTEMLVALATVAYQTVFSAKKKWTGAADPAGRPPFLDTCHALAADGEVVKRQWPEFYTGR